MELLYRSIWSSRAKESFTYQLVLSVAIIIQIMNMYQGRQVIMIKISTWIFIQFIYLDQRGHPLSNRMLEVQLHEGLRYLKIYGYIICPDLS